MHRVGPGGKFRKIAAVEVEPDHRLLLTYDDGEVRRFDCKATILAAGTTEFTAPLAAVDFFQKVRVERGNLVWPNGFDLHGNDVYHASVQA